MDREETLPLVDFHLHTTASDGCRTPAQVVERLLALGLDGLEAYYLDFSEAQRAELAALAGQQRLYCTAGSDCHGFAHRDRMGLPCSPALLAALPPVLRG